jgi:hypothetical protein
MFPKFLGKLTGEKGQAGGHGPFTSKYGLGVDQVLEYQVVTADGAVSSSFHPRIMAKLSG